MNDAGLSIEEIRMKLKDGDRTVSLMEAFAEDYLERNGHAAIPKIKEVCLTQEEKRHIIKTMVSMIQGDNGPSTFLGSLENGMLTAVAKADDTNLRAIKLLYWFHYNEVSGMRKPSVNIRTNRSG